MRAAQHEAMNAIECIESCDISACDRLCRCARMRRQACSLLSAVSARAGSSGRVCSCARMDHLLWSVEWSGVDALYSLDSCSLPSAFSFCVDSYSRCALIESLIVTRSLSFSQLRSSSRYLFSFFSFSTKLISWAVRYLLLRSSLFMLMALPISITFRYR